MKIIFIPLVLFAFLNSCQSSSKSLGQPVESASKVNHVCKKLLVDELLKNREWDDVYKIFATENNQPLSTDTLIGFIQDSFSVHDYAGGGRIGVALEENESGVQSEYAIVSQQAQNYLLSLKEDQIQFLIAQDFNAFSSVQFKKNNDAEFQDLCVESDAHVIETMKLILFRSAVGMYMYDVKDRGDL